MFLSSSVVRPPVLLSSEHGVQRIKHLVSRRAWGDVMHLTTEYLNSSSKPYQPFYSQLLLSKNINIQNTNATIKSDTTTSSDPLLQRLQTETSQLVAFKMHSMLKLRRYADLAREAERLNLIPPMDGSATGQYPLPRWVPYGLKILAAQSLHYTDKPQRCVDTLSGMREHLLSPTELQQKHQWLPRVTVALANSFLQMKEWRMALDALDKLYDSLPEHLAHEVTQLLQINKANELQHDQLEVETVIIPNKATEHDLLYSILLVTLQIEIISRQMRIFLQMGAIPQAQQLQDEVQSHYDRFQELHSQLNDTHKIRSLLQTNVLVQQTHTQVLLNDGLILFARSQFTTAMEKFTNALALQRRCQLGDDWDEDEHFLHTGMMKALDADRFLMTHALNNIALCALYTCKVEYAVELLEGLVKENPTSYLTEVMVFNICTLYELGTDVAGSIRKKTVLQGVAKRFFLHDIGSEHFRIST